MLIPQTGGVVLCGGHSSRMGQPKLMLPFGEETLMQRVCRILADIVNPVVVVAALDQELPTLPNSIQIARDEYDSFGPLAGIATGLAKLKDQCEAAFVTSCDVPLLRSDFVRAVVTGLEDHDTVVPNDGQFDHVLAAAYRTRLEATARELLNTGQRRPLRLIEAANSRRIPVDELRIADPNLDSLRNCNTPEDYQTVLKLAGLAD